MVSNETGEVIASHKQKLISIISTLESLGHSVFCALMADGYKININKPAEAFSLDIGEIKKSDCLLAILEPNHVSAGVQTEIGVAIALGKKVLLAHQDDTPIGYFNNSMVASKQAVALSLPLSTEQLKAYLGGHTSQPWA